MTQMVCRLSYDYLFDGILMLYLFLQAIWKVSPNSTPDPNVVPYYTA